MFSGIIEAIGQIKQIIEEGTNKHFIVHSSFTHELSIDQSVAHDGVCLTVVALDLVHNCYTVTAIEETLIRSRLGELQVGDYVNLERAVSMDRLMDGHIVQGHVDTTGVCTAIDQRDGSTYYSIQYKCAPEMIRKGYFTVEKGSVCVNGVSLTVVDSEADSFRVAIIPFTKEHTNFQYLKVGSTINLEFDIIGKYLAKLNSYN